MDVRFKPVGRIVEGLVIESQTISPTASAANLLVSRQGRWSRRIDGEPSLLELLNDPITLLLMRRDGITPESLETTIKLAQGVLRMAEGGVRQAA